MFVHFLSRLSSRIATFVSSSVFFYIVLGVMGFSALWVALFSLYPMAFDEDFHFGIIRIYADMWTPFSIAQTPDMAVYGSLVTDTSYLFHYLMSFPYRAVALFTDSEVVIVIVLRLINIVFFLASLVVFRKVLLATKISPAVTHGVLAIFTLIPVVPLLAGQINYDNPLLLVTALCLLLAIRMREQLLAKHTLSVSSAFWLVILLLVGVGIKYAYLPIALGIVLYVGFYSIKTWRQHRTFGRTLLADIRGYSWKVLTLSAALLVVCLVLGTYRYVGNLARYGDPVPDCGTVLSVEECSQYGPWGRDYRLAQAKSDNADVRNLPHYTATHWAWGMWHRLFFTLAGPTNGHQTQKQLPIASTAAIVLVAVGAVFALVYALWLFRQYPVFWLFAVVTGVYIAALLAQQYGLYAQTAQPVAINGRYLLLLLPVLGAIAAAAYMYALRDLRAYAFRGLFFAAVLLVLLQGGGLTTYIVRSQPAWFWQNSFVQSTTNSARTLLKPVIVEN